MRKMARKGKRRHDIENRNRSLANAAEPDAKRRRTTDDGYRNAPGMMAAGVLAHVLGWIDEVVLE
jgi:hypothetical protein